MEQTSRDPHLRKAVMTGAVLGAAVLILLTMLSSLLGSGADALWFNVFVSVLTGIVGGIIGYVASRFGSVEEDGLYKQVSINEMMGDIDPNDDYTYEETPRTHEVPVDDDIYDVAEYEWDGTEEHIETYLEPLPEPTAAMPILSLDELAAATVVIEGHVLRTLDKLPPLPASPPTIHHVSVTVDEPETPTAVEEKPDNPRDTLESGDLRDIISILGNQEYIDALQYCLATCEAGSQKVALRAKGRVYGLGARGTKNEDGSTSFTRADVQKMLRKARSITSANVSD